MSVWRGLAVLATLAANGVPAPNSTTQEKMLVHEACTNYPSPPPAVTPNQWTTFTCTGNDLATGSFLDAVNDALVDFHHQSLPSGFTQKAVLFTDGNGTTTRYFLFTFSLKQNGNTFAYTAIFDQAGQVDEAINVP